MGHGAWGLGDKGAGGAGGAEEAEEAEEAEGHFFLFPMPNAQ
ncbi:MULTISPECIES: hypothetical protein [Nostocales]|nr:MULTISPECIES: hypothetical protein [Nostocales]